MRYHGAEAVVGASMAPSSPCSLSIPFIFLIIRRREFEVNVFGGLSGAESFEIIIPS